MHNGLNFIGSSFSFDRVQTLNTQQKQEKSCATIRTNFWKMGTNGRQRLRLIFKPTISIDRPSKKDFMLNLFS